uniref:acylphosphatase n=1 Tax=Kalanchoe fedtschenkoi TaxID=63787 RepID=A0A7N0ZUK3_KALFE
MAAASATSSSALIRLNCCNFSARIKLRTPRSCRNPWRISDFHGDVSRRSCRVLPRNPRLLYHSDPLVPNRASFRLPRPSPHLLLEICIAAADRPRLSRAMSASGAEAESDHSQSTQTKTVRVVIKGRVQGVFYRDWTTENARKLGLKGWVRNRRDGCVEALFSGEPDKVKEMEQRCRAGPPAAMVTGLDVFPSDEDPGDGFERKPTI